MRAGWKYGLIGAAVLVGICVGAWVWAGRPAPSTMLAAATRVLPGVGSDKPKEAEEPPLEVRVVTAETRQVPISFTYTGTIVSPKDALLQARVTGVVDARPFEPGSHVKKGDLLFRIDPRPFQVALASAKAQQEQAKSQLEFAEAEVARTSTLADKGFATEQRFQQLQSNRSSAAAQVQQAEAAIARQELNLDYAKVTAPFDGRASLSTVNVGDLVIENQSELVSVVQLDPIDLQMALSSEDSEAVRKAMAEGRVVVELLDAKGRPVREARIYKLDNRFDPRTARRLVRALVENADERFLPGEFTRAHIRIGSRERLLVPTIALSARLAQRIVYVVSDSGKVQEVPVTTGDAFGDTTAILSGLDAGARVVVDHLQEMQEGRKVEVRTGGAVQAPGDDPADKSADPADDDPKAAGFTPAKGDAGSGTASGGVGAGGGAREGGTVEKNDQSTGAKPATEVRPAAKPAAGATRPARTTKDASAAE